MNKSFIIAKKEYQDILRSRMFVTVLLLLVTLTITSVLVSTFVFKSQVSQYESSLAVLQAIGKTPGGPAPQLFPLNLLRGVVDYIEIIGAILGILLGYLSVAKERNTRTLQLILTRPVTKQDIITGKLLGNLLFVSSVMIFVGVAIWFSFLGIGGVTLTTVEMAKLLIFLVISIVYIMLFFTLSFFFSLQQKTISHALIICFVIWLVVVLILPQIGDTMDPDNQVPGGFFKSMGFNKAQENQVMAKFSGYEHTRSFIEQLSVTKHYERAGFALFGIKEIYNDESVLTVLKEKWFDLLFVILLFVLGAIADYYILLKNKVFSGGG